MYGLCKCLEYTRFEVSVNYELHSLLDNFDGACTISSWSDSTFWMWKLPVCTVPRITFRKGKSKWTFVKIIKHFSSLQFHRSAQEMCFRVWVEFNCNSDCAHQPQRAQQNTTLESFRRTIKSTRVLISDCVSVTNWLYLWIIWAWKPNESTFTGIFRQQIAKSMARQSRAAIP